MEESANADGGDHIGERGQSTNEMASHGKRGNQRSFSETDQDVKKLNKESTTSEPTTEHVEQPTRRPLRSKSRTNPKRMNTPSPKPTSGTRTTSRARRGTNPSSTFASRTTSQATAAKRGYQNNARRSASATNPFSKNTRLTPSSNQPYSAREVDDKTRAVLADIHNFDANECETESLAMNIFASGTGISDDEIRKIMRVRVSSRQMDVEQQVAAGNKVIKRLKDTLTALTKGKNEFVTRSIDSEKAARGGWAQALETAQILDEDRAYLKQKVKQLEVDNTIWKDNAKDTMRELSLAEDKIHILRKDIEELKKKVQEADQHGTQALIALEVEKAKNEANEKQSQGFRETQFLAQTNLEKVRADAFKQAEVELSSKMERERADLKSQLQEQESQMKGLESQIIIAESQFARAIADAEAANARAAAKDLDMSELMKSISEIQRSGQSREEESNKLRRDAEMKVSELEKSLAEIRGEMNVSSHAKSTLSDNLEEAKKELGIAEESLKIMTVRIDSMKTDLNSHQANLTLEKELRLRSEQKESEERHERIALSAQMVAMTKEHAQMGAQLSEASAILEAKWRKKLEVEEQKFTSLGDDVIICKETIAGLEGEIEALKKQLEQEKDSALAESALEIGNLNNELSIMKERFKMEELKILQNDRASEQKVTILEQQIREGQVERRRMHNLIQELRGNVRVFARVRPYLPGDGVDDDAAPAIVANSETTLKLFLDGDESNEHKFSFDRTFPPSAGQEAVFTEVSEFVQSALDGYNVCLFSYGQTGSGKTHTMQGSGFGQMRGIIPRAIEQVGDYKNELEKDGWHYEMQVSFLEIYNETIRDLLRDDDSEMLKHEVKIGTDGRKYVSDLKLVPLDPKDSEGVEAVMRQAAKHRSVGTTEMNEVSSRSHSVFTLHLSAFHSEQRQTLRGTLNLVDLAGSERLNRSGATGDRAKEAMAINKSLSSLTDVFVALGKKASHVPFRNSKLTYLLQPSLSGDGKTLMMVNLSPTDRSTQESLCSLRFATHVNKCELGKAKRSLEDVDEDDASVSSVKSSMSNSSRASRTPRKSIKFGSKSMVTPPTGRSTGSLRRGVGSSARSTTSTSSRVKR